MKKGKPVRARRSKAEQREEMLQRISSAAEGLFAKHGFYGVTLKQIAQSVGVHHALMNYYFRDKEELFEIVFRKAADASVTARMEAMQRYEAVCDDKPTVEGALGAFLGPDLDRYARVDESHHREAGAMIAQISNMPGWGAEFLSLHFDDVVRRLVTLLKQAMPDVPEANIYWGYTFASAALLNAVSRTGRIDKLSGGLCKSEDLVTVKKLLPVFLAGGFDALVQHQKTARSKPSRSATQKVRPPRSTNTSARNRKQK